MIENSNYTEPKHVVKAFVELGLDRQSRILDILAGSGVVAELVTYIYFFYFIFCQFLFET